MKDQILTFTLENTNKTIALKFCNHLGNGFFGSVWAIEGVSDSLIHNEFPHDLVCKKIAHGVSGAVANEIKFLRRTGLLKGYAREGDDYYLLLKKVDFDKRWHDLSLKKQMAAIQSLHNKYHIAHFDIREENVSVNHKGEVTFIDYGISREATYYNSLIEYVLFAMNSNRSLFDVACSYLSNNRKNTMTTLALIYLCINGAPGIAPSIVRTLALEWVLHKVAHELLSLEIIPSELAKLAFPKRALWFKKLNSEEYKKAYKISEKISILMPLLMMALYAYQINDYLRKPTCGYTNCAPVAYNSVWERLYDYLPAFKASELSAVTQHLLLPASNMMDAINLTTERVMAQVKEPADCFFYYTPRKILRDSSSYIYQKAKGYLGYEEKKYLNTKKYHL